MQRVAASLAVSAQGDVPQRTSAILSAITEEYQSICDSETVRIFQGRQQDLCKKYPLLAVNSDFLGSDQFLLNCTHLFLIYFSTYFFPRNGFIFIVAFVSFDRNSHALKEIHPRIYLSFLLQNRSKLSKRTDQILISEFYINTILNWNFGLYKLKQMV